MIMTQLNVCTSPFRPARARSRVKHLCARVTEEREADRVFTCRQIFHFDIKDEGDAARTVQNMDRKPHLINMRGLNPPKFTHLKPLSNYWRRIISDQETTLHHLGHFSNPFINFKIEVLNNSSNKRTLDVCSFEDRHEPPLKKPFSPKASSPDLGCCMDYCSPPTRQDSVSGIKEESSRPPSDHVQRRSPAGPRGDEEPGRYSLRCEGAVLNAALAFDCDVDDILDLNPSGGGPAAGRPDGADGPGGPQGEERGAGREEPKNQACLDVEEDKGYVSTTSVHEGQTGTNSPQSATCQLTPESSSLLGTGESSSLLRTGESSSLLRTGESSSLLRTGESEQPETETHPEGSPEPRCREQAARCCSFTVDDSCPAAGGRPSEPVSFGVESFEGDVEELWDIGAPVLESSMCHGVSMKEDAAGKKVQEGVTEPVHDRPAATGGEDLTLDTSFETTLPLRVQVKSKVVELGPQTTSCEAVRPGSRARTHRHLSDFNWEVEKHNYVQLVSRHTCEKRGADQGVMCELQNLMSRVADRSDESGPWQHPSDFTRRNYQRRFGNETPKTSLNDWRSQNDKTHKRFAWLPKIFRRSPFP